jgi:hypothetical protein
MGDVVDFHEDLRSSDGEGVGYVFAEARVKSRNSTPHTDARERCGLHGLLGAPW